MAGQAPNPREFKTWEDAFQYPVPVVRRLEQQLRGQINENRDKLRSLVGTSYRDLLGTAERIIDMDEQMHEAEEILGGIGQKCNARAIERIAVNHARATKSQKDRVARRNALASTIALLQNCMTQAGRVIKRGDPPLIAAKLLVLARLLHGGASKSADPPPLLESLRSKLVSLRRRLLDYTDRVLADVDTDKAALVELLAAYSLATTSTPTDVLRHFLQVRATALREVSEVSSNGNVHTAMDLLIATLKDVQSVFPKRLADLLARLQGDPLLKDSDVRRIPELNLSVYERWIADDVRNFTPWLRHDQLQSAQAVKIVREWAGNAKRVLLAGLKQFLDAEVDAHRIIDLRKDILTKCLSTDRKLTVLDIPSFFQDLRSCFVERLQNITRDAGHELIEVVTKSLDSEAATYDGATTPMTNMWDPANAEIDLSKGALEFRTFITNCYHGKDGRLKALDRSLSQWSTDIAVLSGTIKAMKEDRWNDDLDLDIDDDLDLDDPQSLLAREDPYSLAELLGIEKDKALSHVYKQIQQRAQQDQEQGRNSMFLSRLVREVMQRASSTGDSTAAPSKPPPSLFEQLNTGLVHRVIGTSSAGRKTGAAKSLRFTRAPATTLWEGTPALPVQPSASCFRFLGETCKAMEDAGSDLWTPSAVDALKAGLRGRVAEAAAVLMEKSSRAEENITSEDRGAANGHVQSEEGDESRVEANGSAGDTAAKASARHDAKLVQALYDVLYLDRVLGVSAERRDAATALGAASSQLQEQVKLEGAAVDRLRKSAADYHKRTYLLFGILASC